MPTIVERVQTLHARLKAHVEHAAAAQRASKFTERVGAVRDVRGRLERALAKVAVLRVASAQLTATEMAPVHKLSSPAKATEALRAVYDKLKTAPLTLNEGKEFATFRRRFDECTSGVEQAVINALAEIERGSPKVDEAFLKQVETVPSYDERVRDIRAKRDEFKTVSLRDVDASTVRVFLECRAALRTAVDALAPEEFPLPVIEFFRAARRANGASLELLTDEVRAWLVQRDLLKKLRVRLEG